jgi:hypothetical protein
MQLMTLSTKLRRHQENGAWGDEWHIRMSAAMNAVDAMNYNPSIPADPDYRCHFTHDWVYDPVEWNGRLYSGASLHVFLEEKEAARVGLKTHLPESMSVHQLNQPQDQN